MNLKILLVGDIQYPKGMSNSEFYFLATSQPASTINVLMVFQLNPPKHTVIKKNSELDMPFGYEAHQLNPETTSLLKLVTKWKHWF
jgi:hypothetical protein